MIILPITEQDFEQGRSGKLTSAATDVFRRRTLRRCKLCKHLRCSELEEKYFRKEITQTEIARIVGLSEQQVSEHFRYHVPQQVSMIIASKTGQELAEIVVDKLGLLKKHIVKLDEKVVALYNLNTLDPSTVQSIKALVSELRNFIKDSALLEGELRAAPTIKLQQINLQFNQLKQMVLHELPKEYQEKVLQALGQVEELERS